MELEDKLVFGGIYKATTVIPSRYRDSLNDQKYGFFVPVCIESNGVKRYYMIDTYEIDSSYSYGNEQTRYDTIVNKFINMKNPKVGYNVYHYAVFNYYYNNTVEVTTSNIDTFKLIADLREYRPISNRDAENYLEKDVLRNVMLWWECKYPSGYTLVRKEAKENFSRKIDAKIHDIMSYIKFPKAGYEDDFKELEQLVFFAKENNNDYDSKEVKNILEIRELLLKQEKEIDELLNKQKEKQEEI